MARQSTAPVYVSRNHLGGSFTDVPLDGILAGCAHRQVTGTIDIECGGLTGQIDLRAGAVADAHFGDTTGPRALHDMRQLVDGSYEITQRLPDLTGELGGTAVRAGEVERVPLEALMRHCAFHALTCTITMVSRDDRAQLDYHAGDLKRVELNGFYDDDAIVQVFDWTDARFRVSAPALDLDIQGWPRARPTTAAPVMRERFPRGTSPIGLVAVVERWMETAPAEALAASPAPSAASRARSIRATTLHGTPPPATARPMTPTIAPRSHNPGVPAVLDGEVPMEEIETVTSRSGFTVRARAEVLPPQPAGFERGRSRADFRWRPRFIVGIAILAMLVGVMIAAL
jgi:hypothetical protein